ncbi:PQQ-binding-like beta-propeller repeat protein [Planctomycetales bacterium ZRK34]|nr:PQQ-binding-like beta-propeller repeat protein [Planctomycetales bacterium ZRK34]
MVDSPTRSARRVVVLAVCLGAVVLLCGAGAMGWWLTLEPAEAIAARIPREDPLGTGSTRTGGPAEGRLIAGSGKPSQLPGSWPQFRGPDRTGMVNEAAGLARAWSDAGPKVLWSLEVGDGYAGPIVEAGRVYLMDYDREAQADALRCLSLDDGTEMWRFAYPVVIKRNHGMSRTTPAVADGCVVAIGPKCHVICVDATGGKLLWSMDLVRDFGTRVPDWYAGQCPLIDNGRVILAPSGREALMVAVDLHTGKELWRTPNPMRWQMTHASLAVMEFAGRRMAIYCGSGGVAGIDLADGKLLWKTTEWKIPIATVPSPVVLDDGRLFLSGGYDAGAMMLRLKAGDNGTLEPTIEYQLRSREFGATQHTPILRDGYLYGIRPPRGELTCLDLGGKVLWASGRGAIFGLGPLLIAGDLIYALNENGKLVLAQATPAAYQPLGEAQVLEGHEAWGPMALAGTRLLVRDLTTLRCLDVGATP